MFLRVCTLFMLASLLGVGCSEPLDTTACTRNDDCEEGYACDLGGVCQEAAQLQIDAKILVDAFKGEAYSDTVRASGGIPDYTWSLSLVDPGETRLDWIEIVASTGEIRNQPGEFPSQLGTDLGIRVTVKDMSNHGEGQEANQDFMVHIKECREDADCWEYGEDQGLFGCRQGTRTCTDGVLSGQCVLTGWSPSTDHCGDSCDSCDTEKADQCLEGNCACGQTGGPCPVDETCCSSTCTDLKDLTHCGACDTPCQPQNVLSASCDQGTCTYDQCEAGFYDCDSNEANGCETISGLDNCNGCDDACTNQTLYPNTTGHSCPASVCVYQCVQGYADCEAGQPGCETPLGSETHCATCNDACTGSATGGNACIDDVGSWRCGCLTVANCDIVGDDMCCPSPGPGVCTPHNKDHCEDCDTGCTIATGGPWCNPDGYICQCTTHDDCKGNYGFSEARCSPADSTCFCQGTVNCTGTVDDMCCIVSAANECVDLAAHAENCGICGAVCTAGETCSDGACSCSGGTCPSPSGAPDCGAGNECVCFFYGGEPCPAGQYCCTNEGCCLEACGTLNNECSIACITGSDIWCDWGCCDTCQTENDC